MNYSDFDIDNLFVNKPFEVDKHLLIRLQMLKDALIDRYREEPKLIIIQGARTEESNIEYYQIKYGDSWKKHYCKNSLHVIKEETGNILRAVDIAFELANGSRISGIILSRIVQERYLFSNVGISKNYIHVDVLVRTWFYHDSDDN